MQLALTRPLEKTGAPFAKNTQSVRAHRHSVDPSHSMNLRAGILSMLCGKHTIVFRMP
jgi:hypothetical protein